MYTGYCPATEEEWLKFLQLKEKQDACKRSQCLLCVTECLGESSGSSQPVKMDTTTSNEPANSSMLPFDDGTIEDPLTRASLIEGDSVETSHWPDEITWEKLGHLLISDIGAEAGLKILTSVKVPESSLPYNFFQTCVSDVLLAKQQRYHS